MRRPIGNQVKIRSIKNLTENTKMPRRKVGRKHKANPHATLVGKLLRSGRAHSLGQASKMASHMRK